jgi:hypothetical protein
VSILSCLNTESLLMLIDAHILSSAYSLALESLNSPLSNNNIFTSNTGYKFLHMMNATIKSLKQETQSIHFNMCLYDIDYMRNPVMYSYTRHTETV